MSPIDVAPDSSRERRGRSSAALMKFLQNFFPGKARQVQPTAKEKEPAKKSKLDDAIADLVEGEVTLTCLRLELASFEGMYLRTVGVLYAELDEVNAQSADRVAQTLKTSSSKYQAQRARERAARSRARAVGPAASTREFRPTAELKQYYREIVRRAHPELTADLTERAKREQLMLDARNAFEHSDASELDRLMNACGVNAVSLEAGILLDEVEATTCQITQIQQRLSQIEADTEQLMQSELALQWTKAEAAKAEGRDLLSEMAKNLLPQIRSARNRCA